LDITEVEQPIRQNLPANGATKLVRFEWRAPSRSGEGVRGKGGKARGIVDDVVEQ
jgi:hypothetical protein